MKSYLQFLPYCSTPTIKTSWLHQVFVVQDTSFQNNLIDLAAFSTFLIVFLEVFNSFEISFLDIHSKRQII